LVKVNIMWYVIYTPDISSLTWPVTPAALYVQM